MKIICLVIVAITVDIVNGKCASFYKELRVAPANHSSYTLSSNTRIPNHEVCAKLCNTEECLSFSYTEATKRCETYSRMMINEKEYDISMSQKFFSRAIRNCSDVETDSPSVIRRSELEDGSRLTLLCDMDTEDGPWTVIQRQTNGTFSRTWTEYKHGFGDLFGDFWIGNDYLHLLTKTPKILRVELEGWDGRSASVQYSEFQVANEDQKYKLLVQGFSGDIHDGMKSHNGKLFSTFDQDNDEFGGNCAKNHKGGWWFTACSQADLNGLKYWWYFPRPLIKSRMMIR